MSIRRTATMPVPPFEPGPDVPSPTVSQPGPQPGPQPPGPPPPTGGLRRNRSPHLSRPRDEAGPSTGPRAGSGQMDRDVSVASLTGERTSRRSRAWTMPWTRPRGGAPHRRPRRRLVRRLGDAVALRAGRPATPVGRERRGPRRCPRSGRRALAITQLDALLPYADDVTTARGLLRSWDTDGAAADR